MKIVFLVVLSVAVGVCTPARKEQSPPDAAGSIAWLQADNLDMVLAEARKSGKPVFLEFYATWCGPCKLMERNVFSQPEVINQLNQDFISFHVDVDAVKGKPIAQRYGIRGMPTVVFTDTRGEEIGRALGLLSVRDFLGSAADALAVFRGK
jgi:thiol:disulfide interchange protein